MEYYGGPTGKDKRDGYVYDVKIKGIDANFWANVTGTPTLSSGTIVLNATTISSFILHEFADVEFLLKVPVKPTSGDVRQWGLFGPTATTYGAIYFKVAGTVFTANVVDDQGNLTSKTLTWDDTDWTNVSTLFRIVCLPDRIQFWTGIVTAGVAAYTLQATIASPISGLPITALPITIQNGNADNMVLSYLVVRNAAGIV
jgi:hypothetical protein